MGWADAGEPLWRHVLGQHLRRLRLLAGQTLDETSRRAGVSPQYLSEMERGIKAPSSEMIAAVAGALGVTLLDLTVAVARELNSQRSTAQPPAHTEHAARTARTARTNAQGFALAA